MRRAGANPQESRASHHPAVARPPVTFCRLTTPQEHLLEESTSSDEWLLTDAGARLGPTYANCGKWSLLRWQNDNLPQFG